MTVTVFSEAFGPFLALVLDCGTLLSRDTPRIQRASHVYLGIAVFL